MSLGPFTVLVICAALCVVPVNFQIICTVFFVLVYLEFRSMQELEQELEQELDEVIQTIQCERFQVDNKKFMCVLIPLSFIFMH